MTVATTPNKKSSSKQSLHRRHCSCVFAAITNVGQVRDHNEDAYLASPPLFVVADGLGGHEAGEVASNIAIDTIKAKGRHIETAQDLRRAVEAANAAIISGARRNLGRAGMGTTLTAARIFEGKALLAQVGDSRGYLFRSGRLAQITQDHSVVAAMVRSGSISPEEARIHPNRNVITRALGSDPGLEVDTYEYETLPGDRWLLCSDGLYGMVDDSAIEKILSEVEDPNRAAEMLVESANDAGGSDNITVIIIDVDVETATRNEHKRTRAKSVATFAGVIAFVALLFAGLGVGIVQYARSRAYIAASPEGTVAVYAGVPGSVMGARISKLSDNTTIPVNELSAIDRAKVESEETFNSKEAAMAMIEHYRESLASQSSTETTTSQPATNTTGTGAAVGTP